MVALAKADRQHKLPGAGIHGDSPMQVHLTHDRDVAVGGRAVLPVHPEVVLQVLPAIACAHKPARSPCKAAVRRHRERYRVVPGQQHARPCHIHHPR